MNPPQHPLPHYQPLLQNQPRTSLLHLQLYQCQQVLVSILSTAHYITPQNLQGTALQLAQAVKLQPQAFQDMGQVSNNQITPFQAPFLVLIN